MEGRSTPLLNDPEARVRLHPTVGAATDELRARKEALVKSGWKVERGTLGKSVIVLVKSGETRVIGVDRARRISAKVQADEEILKARTAVARLKRG